jgi:imidazolonepropionase-like amidohydrolase
MRKTGLAAHGRTTRAWRRVSRAAAAVVLGAAASLATASPSAAAERPTAFVNCRIIADPQAPAVANGVLVMRGGRIEALGPAARVSAPADAERVDCAGGVLAAAFWNTHVHLLGPQWLKPGEQPAERLSGQFETMFSRHGFAHVVDTGSNLGDALVLARRTATGEVRGPGILTAGMPFIAPDGTPFYAEGLDFPELQSPAQARTAVGAAVDGGAAAIKVMAVSLKRSRPYPEMDPATLRAAVEEAHRRGVKVLAHPTDRRGVELSLETGVDVLVHTTPLGGPWDPALARRMAQAGLWLTPTLKLWPYETRQAEAEVGRRMAETARQQVAAFRAAGGRVLFGTDVGYMTEDDPLDEYVAMAAAGMSSRDLLASLTTLPVAAYAPGRKQGRLAPGYDADLVLLARDPDQDVRNLASVRRTYRAGRLIYEGPAGR